MAQLFFIFLTTNVLLSIEKKNVNFCFSQQETMTQFIFFQNIQNCNENHSFHVFTNQTIFANLVVKIVESKYPPFYFSGYLTNFCKIFSVFFLIKKDKQTIWCVPKCQKYKEDDQFYFFAYQKHFSEFPVRIF